MTVPPPSPPAAVKKTILSGAPVVVPAKFVGMHVNRWPSGDPVSSPPSYQFGTIRSLNYDPAGPDDGVFWRNIQKTQNSWAWSNLDQWVDTWHAQGKDLMYSFYGTPQWASTRPGQMDPYNAYGGDSKPTDLAHVRTFITELVKRYNGNGTRKIKYLEVWNEPDTGNGMPYWRDSISDLAALARAVYQAAKAVDPGIIVLGPAWVDSFNQFRADERFVGFANASDQAGGTGKQWMDAVAWHHYDYSFNIEDLVDQIGYIKTALQKAGQAHLPMHLTEIGGMDWSSSWPSTADKTRQIQRWMMVAAATGQKSISLYMHDTMSHLGNPAGNTTISSGIQEMYQALTGKTITAAALLSDNSVWLAFGDGSTLRR
ncbi:MAG TPA: hypothetical protein VM491_13005 [Burkholderiaceae bacterium]|nr:hypothetical protein [Burkholderiaceae bacterium]